MRIAGRIAYGADRNSESRAHLLYSALHLDRPRRRVFACDGQALRLDESVNCGEVVRAGRERLLRRGLRGGLKTARENLLAQVGGLRGPAKHNRCADWLVGIGR